MASGTNPFYAGSKSTGQMPASFEGLSVEDCPVLSPETAGGKECPVTGVEVESEPEEVRRGEEITSALRKAPWPPVEGEDTSGYATDTEEGPEGLSNLAVASNIPRGDGDADPTWTFPSPARFYKAMVRKGWKPEVGDMSTIVSIHNTMNEMTWDKVAAWEKLHEAECCAPTLKRFYRVFGSDDDWSPKARINAALGYKRPFDRHDWIVDRCGKEVRYIIDFYPGAIVPGSTMPSIYLDVRPAIDSPSALIDRIRMLTYSLFPSLHPQAQPSQTSQP